MNTIIWILVGIVVLIAITGFTLMACRVAGESDEKEEQIFKNKESEK